MQISNPFERKKPEDVFTPRSTEVTTMYVNRPEHEGALDRAIRSGYNIVIYGDSGCGKSWLYKRAFSERKIYYTTIDLSLAQNSDDVDIQLLEAVSVFDEWKEIKKENSASGGAKPMGVGFEQEDTVSFERLDVNPFANLLKHIRHNAKKKTAFLVLENLEYILEKPDVVERVQMMLLALDDPSVGKYKVRVCLVGVPAEIKDILTDGNKYQTISNRVFEIPEVGRLARESVELLVKRGLEQELDFTVESSTYCYSQIAFCTDRVPQYVHDICLHAAFLGEDNALTITPDIIEIALENWIDSNARQSREFVESTLHSNNRYLAERAQILYAISRTEHIHFTAKDILKEFRILFPITSSKKNVRMTEAFRRLTSGENRILSCDKNRRVFRVASPKIRMVLRVCLRMIEECESIEIVRW